MHLEMVAMGMEAMAHLATMALQEAMAVEIQAGVVHRHRTAVRSRLVPKPDLRYPEEAIMACLSHRLLTALPQLLRSPQ